MHNRHDPRVLPMRDGVNPSCVVLPSIVHGLLLDFLVQRLPAVSRADWLRRLGAGEVVDEQGVAATAQSPCTPGLRYYYYRELPSETPIPFEETVLYQDEHILVADKPHFLPVVPAGRYLQQTLLVRLKRRLGLPELSPVHRIDRDTAGLVLFSVQRATRGMYQALFRERAVRKVYEAVAPWRADLPLPRVHESRLEELGPLHGADEAEVRPVEPGDELRRPGPGSVQIGEAPGREARTVLGGAEDAFDEGVVVADPRARVGRGDAQPVQHAQHRGGLERGTVVAMQYRLVGCGVDALCQH